MVVSRLALAIAAPEVPSHTSLLLAPQDWGVHLALNPRAAAASVLLSTASLTSCLSTPAVKAVQDLWAALQPGCSGEAPVTSSGPSSTAASTTAASNGADAEACSGTWAADDLACGLFSLSDDLSGPPGVLNISLGDDAAGRAPWDGSGDSWVAWRYPYGRAVRRLELRDVPAELAEADLELTCQPRGCDGVRTVPVHRTDRAFRSDARHILLEATVSLWPHISSQVTPENC